jgi:hypothetical protein
MLGQIILLLALTYSLWAWLYFSELQATVVAVATLLSFLVAGGFTQSIGREGIYYLGHENGRLAKQACFRMIALGSVTVVSCGALAFGIGWAADVPNELVAVGLMYFVLLAHLWLFLSILYVSKDFLAILLITMAGVGPVDLVMRLTCWGIYAAHGLGLLTALTLAGGFGYYRLEQAARKTKAELSGARLPLRAITVYEVLPYFAYGVLYFAFLSMDRVNAWSAPSAGARPFFLRFRTPYEAGTAAALISLFLTLAVLQYTINSFSDVLISRQETFRATELSDHNAYFQRFYRRHLFLLLTVGAVSIAATYLALYGIEWSEAAPALADLFGSHVTQLVFAIAAAGYFLMAAAVFNVLFFFTLGRPGLVLRSITPAVLVNAGVGYAASRTFGYEYASLGLLAGSAVFALISTAIALDVFEHFDFYYYSAY